MISHLRVKRDKAEEAKDFLKINGYLNGDYLPIKEDGFVLWPLNLDSVPFEGTIVRCDGVSYTKHSRDYRSNLSNEVRIMAPRSFDIFGDIAILRLVDDLDKHKVEIADALLLSHKNIRTVCVDLGVKGDFRIRELEIISGVPNFISIHKENGVKFSADISKVYFSPRLATERERLYSLAEKGEVILDAFAGVAPFSILLAKKGCNVLSLDSNPDAKKWALKNFKLNDISSKQYSYYNSKFEEYVFGNEKFDRIIMNNPTNSLIYLDKAMNLVAEEGVIHLYLIAPKEDSFAISDHLRFGYECTGKKEVHAYSPSSSLFVFDIKRNPN